MSAKYLQIHIAPADDAARDRFLQFETQVRDKKHSEIEALDGDGRLSPVETLVDQLDIMSTRSMDAEHILIDAMASTNVDAEALLGFLCGLGASRLEAELFNSQVGEYEFYLDSDPVDDYDSTDWNWLQDPGDGEEVADVSKLPSPYREVAALFEKNDLVAAFRTLTENGIAGTTFGDLAENAPATYKDYMYGRDDDEPGVYLHAYREQQGSPRFGLVLTRDRERESLRWPTMQDLAHHVESLGIDELWRKQADD